MKNQDDYSSAVTWILVALLALIFVGVAWVDGAYQSTFISFSLIAGLAALAYVGFQQRGKK